jgi:RHS repeat-associated protein
VASSTGTGAKYATTTEYVFNGDSLVSTVDQQTASGVATGTAQTRFIHPDHLGSTNVVTNASGTVVQTLDYYPYGATRISASTGGADSARKYIGQFADPSNLDYLNARYYESSRGQFLTEDPVFLGQPKAQHLLNPQSLNSYSYANDNPIANKDPLGRDAYGDFFYNTLVPSRYQSTVNDFALNMSNSSPAFDFAISHPYLTSGVLSIGLTSVGAPALEASETYATAYSALQVGNTSAAAARIIPFALYSGAATGNLLTLPSYFNGLREANSSGSYERLAFESALRMIPAAGNLYGTLTSSLLVSNLSTGAASLSTLMEDLNYANSALLLLNSASNQNSQKSNPNTTSSGPIAPASSPSGTYGQTGLPAGYHTACGTLCR